MARQNRLYMLYDKVSEMVVGQMLLYKSDGPAIRSFHEGLAGEHLRNHAEDFDLLFLGEQLEDGTIVPEASPVVTATGAQWKAQAMVGADPVVDPRQLEIPGAERRNGRKVPRAVR